MDPGENIKVNVRSIEDRNEGFELNRNDNILKLRQLSGERFRGTCTVLSFVEIETNSILLLFRGKALKDDQTISNCNISNGDTVLLVKRQHVEQRLISILSVIRSSCKPTTSDSSC